jgi:glycine hydroxymethyltransferase
LRFGFSLVTGGTDNHLILIDLTNKNVSGKKAAQALDRAGMCGNYNSVPFDTRKPFDPSGLRIGTPAITSRGMGTDEMKKLAAWMNEVVANVEDEQVIGRIAGEIKELCRSFPAPGLSAQR